MFQFVPSLGAGKIGGAIRGAQFAEIAGHFIKALHTRGFADLLIFGLINLAIRATGNGNGRQAIGMIHRIIKRNGAASCRGHQSEFLHAQKIHQSAKIFGGCAAIILIGRLGAKITAAGISDHPIACFDKSWLLIIPDQRAASGGMHEDNHRARASAVAIIELGAGQFCHALLKGRLGWKGYGGQEGAGWNLRQSSAQRQSDQACAGEQPDQAAAADRFWIGQLCHESPLCCVFPKLNPQHRACRVQDGGFDHLTGS